MFLCFFFSLSAFNSAITLDIIRSKLDPINPDRYRDVPSFIDDVRLLFDNVYLFYRVSLNSWWTQSSKRLTKFSFFISKFSLISIFFFIFFDHRRTRKFIKMPNFWINSSMSVCRSFCQTTHRSGTVWMAVAVHMMQSEYALRIKHQPK